ncbi:HK97 family phage prohead protease [Enterococcus italicus]|uniref:HK97 family phage prohead protease n=1 Tax=Enterococcus italicus TaxID=246144 RepID=UPI0020740F12|nr:HK97 family phage prohead protease [Enterococcus italicus]
MKTRHMYFASKLQTRDLSDNQEPTIEGYFAVFEQETELYPGCFESIAQGAFDNSLKNNDIRCLFNHRTDLVLGREKAGTLKLTTDEHGLYGVVNINQNDDEAMNVYQRVKRGDITGCSFGFNPIQEEIIEQEDGTVRFNVKEADTVEVSIVTFPAYPQTEIEARQASITNEVKRKLDLKKRSLKERMKKWR